MVSLLLPLDALELEMEDILDLQPTQTSENLLREDVSEYVAQLQLHMALHARRLVPTLTQTGNSREQLLHQTQASSEKLASRQLI